MLSQKFPKAFQKLIPKWMKNSSLLHTLYYFLSKYCSLVRNTAIWNTSTGRNICTQCSSWLLLGHPHQERVSLLAQNGGKIIARIGQQLRTLKSQSPLHRAAKIGQLNAINNRLWTSPPFQSLRSSWVSQPELILAQGQLSASRSPFQVWPEVRFLPFQSDKHAEILKNKLRKLFKT